MSNPNWITSPEDQALDELCDQLSALSPQLEQTGTWPTEQLAICARYGVFSWFLPTEWGGQAWSDVNILRGYMRLSTACLTTTFILTQRMGACGRIAVSNNAFVGQQHLTRLISGEIFATVAISHLTTSRRHLAQPVLQVVEASSGFTLNGYSAWVTGAAHADVIVTGATLADGQQILVALPTDLPGVSAAKPEELVSLTASHTGRLDLKNVQVEKKWLLSGPAENVMRHGGGAGTGGLQTSALALGLADAAIQFLENEQQRRSELAIPVQALREDWQTRVDDLFGLAGGVAACSNEQLRTNANSLALRSAQSALAVAKGTGYVVGHPAGRWCREALFFLVWSCPQPVVSANLCELAGIE